MGGCNILRLLHETLKKLAETFAPESYLEIGVREGDSLKAVLEGHHPKNITLCDTWGGAYGGTDRGSSKHIVKMLEELNYEGGCNILDGNSHELIPLLDKKTFDLITVDGDHSYNGALADLRNCWKILNPGGILVFDDIIHPSHKYLEACMIAFITEVDAEILRFDNENDNGVVVLFKYES